MTVANKKKFYIPFLQIFSHIKNYYMYIWYYFSYVHTNYSYIVM